MFKLNFKQFLYSIGLVFITSLTSCAPPLTPIATSIITPSQTNIPMTATSALPSATPSRTATQPPTPTVTPTPLISPTPLPTSTPNPGPTTRPVLAGTPLARPTQPIALDNVSQIVELARWGKGKVEEIRYSPDGRVLAVRTATGQYVYDGQTLAELPLTSELWQAAFPADEPKFELKQVQGGTELWRENTRITLIPSLGPFVFSVDRSVLATPQDSLSVGLWDTTTGTLFKKFVAERSSEAEELFCGGIESVAISADQQLLAAGCYERGGIFIWRVADGQLVAKFFSASHFALNLAFSPDGSQLAGTILGGDICLWAVPAGTLRHCFFESQGSAYSLLAQVTFSPDGRTLVGGFNNGEVLAWQVRSRQLLRRLHPTTPSGVSLAFSADGQHLATTAFSEVIVWDSQTGTARTSTERNSTISLAAFRFAPPLLSGPTGEIEFVAFAPQGNTVVFINNASELFYWSLDEPRTPQPVEPIGGIVAFTAAGEVTTVINATDLAAANLTPLASLDAPNYNTYAFSPDAALIAETVAGRMGSELRVQRTSDSQTLWTLRADYPAGITFSSDGAWLAFDTHGQVQVWRVSDWTLQYTLGDSATHWRTPSFSPNGQLLATADGDGVIHLWRAADGQFLRTLEGHAGWVGDLAFSPDGAFLASTSGDGTVRLWGVP